LKSANRIIRPFVVLLTVGLIVTLLIPIATHSTRAGQETATQAQPAVTGFNGLQEGQELSGKVVIEAVVAGNNIDRVVFQLDGPQSKKYTDRSAPYFFRGDSNGVPNRWNTTRYPDGDYALTATATDTAGQIGELTVHFRIANNAQPQPTATTAPEPTATASPAPASGPVITGFNGVQEGQVLSGTVAIEALVSGENIAQVVFQLAGPRPATHTEYNPPYFFMGDDNGAPKGWDTTQGPNGDYTLTATASDAAGLSGLYVVHFPIVNNSQPQPTSKPTATATAASPATATPVPTASPTAAPPTATPVPNATPPPPSIGKLYYVAINGNDSNPGSEAQPFRTIAKGASLLAPGDTLLVKPGTYAESLMYNIPSGTDWNKPVTIKAYDPANRPIIKPNPGADRVLHFQTYRGQVQRYIVVDGFVLDAANTTYDTVKITVGANHIRLMNSEVKNAPNQGILTSELGSDYNEFINLDIHDNGNDTQFDHGLYISTSGNVIDHCLIHHNAGYGIHIYSGDPAYKPNNNVAKNNTLYDGQGRHGGMIISVGDGNLAYNNLLYNTPTGIEVGYDASNSKVYNNVVYGLTGGTSGASNGIGIFVYSNGTSSIYNNIVSKNSGVGIRNLAAGTTLIKNNLAYQNSQDISNGGPATMSGNITGRDPLFINVASHDYHLQAGSPAIDAGATVAEAQADADGIARPQGAAYDIGAYEYHAP
jgi:hypothetical protein